jgi:hypothetical protein
MKIVRETPAAVRDWLEPLASRPYRTVALPESSAHEGVAAKIVIENGDPTAIALLTDERMAVLWKLLGDRPDPLALIQVAFHCRNPLLLANLERSPDERTAFGFAEAYLATEGDHLLEAVKKLKTAIEAFRAYKAALDGFIIALEWFPGTHARFEGEVPDELFDQSLIDSLELFERNLNKYVDVARSKATEQREFYRFIGERSPRGRGDRHARIFRDAIANRLKRLLEAEGTRLTQERQDEIVATLEGVVFKSNIDANAVRRDRERQKRTRRREATRIKPA